jgi:hypothetical protein
MTEFQSLGTWVGLIGGASGFIAVLLQWRSIYVDSPRISIKCTFAISTYDAKQFYSVEVINKGAKSISISNLGLAFENKMHSTFNLYEEVDRLGSSLPFRIDSHSSESWLFGKDATFSAIREMGVKPNFRAYVYLATGKKIFSKKIKMNLS